MAGTRCPLLGHSGHWWQQGGLRFDGPLAAMNPRMGAGAGAANITLDFPLGDGTVQTVDYTLAMPKVLP